jgi:hypothetical protein
LTAGVPFPTKFFFGIGASGECASNGIFNVLVFFYYQQIPGLSGSLAGFAIDLYIKSLSQSVPSEVADDAIFRLGLVHSPWFWGIIACPWLHGYRIDRNCYEGIQPGLAQSKQ